MTPRGPVPASKRCLRTLTQSKNMMTQRSFLLFSVFALAACQSESQQTAQQDTATATAAETSTAAPSAQAVRVELINAQRQPVGSATLTESGQGVQVALQLTNLPAGTHGLHFHQNGACEPPFESAGPHFNPTNRQHGTENPQGPHAGDLPNITIGQSGGTDTTVVSNMVTLQPDQPNSLLKQGGTSLMIHATADDYKTDPSGNSGARIACGVISQHQQQ